jgi:hypothetical protein
MPKRLFLFVALMLLLAPILAIGVRPAKSDDVTIFTQNFDNEFTGTQPMGWLWTSIGEIRVNDTVYHGSQGKSARYVGLLNESDLTAEKLLMYAWSGSLEFSFAIMPENPDYFSLYICDNYYDGANICFLPNMTMAYHDVSGFHSLGSFSLETWYEVRMDINVTANTYDIYLGSLLVAQSAHFDGKMFTNWVRVITFGVDPSGTPSGFIDDLSLIAVGIKPPEPPALLKIVNPLTGNEWFNFTPYSKKVGDTFIVNVTIANVKDMVGWQFALQWNSSLLECVNATIPSDNVLAYWNSTAQPMVVGGPDLSHSGFVLYGATVGYAGNTGFNGSGVLAQVEFKIIQTGGQSELSFEGVIPHFGDTYLLHGNIIEIPFVSFNANYSYNDSGPLGDVNNDGAVDMKDVATVVLAFNSFPNTPRWNGLADLDSSGRIDMRDIVIVILCFNRR